MIPEELMRWLNKRTFGVPDPGASDGDHAFLVGYVLTLLTFWKTQFHSIYQIVYMVGEQVQMTEILQSVPKSMILLSILNSWKLGNKKQNQRRGIQ